MDEVTKKITAGVGVGSASTLVALATILAPFYMSLQREIESNRERNMVVAERLGRIEASNEKVIQLLEWMHGRDTLATVRNQ